MAEQESKKVDENSTEETSENETKTVNYRLISALFSMGEKGIILFVMVLHFGYN